MRKSRALALLFSVAVLAAGSLAGASNAAEFDPAGSITATSQGDVTLRTSSFTATCEATITGQLNSGIGASEGEEVGDMDSMAFAGCDSLPITAIGAPWAIAFTRADLVARPPVWHQKTLNFGFNITLGGNSCQWRGDVPERLPAIDSPPRLNVLEFLSNTLNLIRGGIFCPSTAQIQGNFNMTEQTWTP